MRETSEAERIDSFLSSEERVKMFNQRRVGTTLFRCSSQRKSLMESRMYWRKNWVGAYKTLERNHLGTLESPKVQKIPTEEGQIT